MSKDGEMVVTGTAAVLNDLADTIGEWADSKGFREDWEDADFLDAFADRISIADDPAYSGDLAERIHKIAKNHRRMANVTKLLLMVSEISESLEGMRDGTNYGEELGDLVIRVFENANKNNIPIGDEIVNKVNKNYGREHKHGRAF